MSDPGGETSIKLDEVKRNESFTIPEDEIIEGPATIFNNSNTLPKSPPAVKNFVDDDPNGDGTNVHYRKQRRTSSHAEQPKGLPNGRPMIYNRNSSYAPSMGGYSHHTEFENVPPPSTPAEKSKMTKKYFVGVFGVMYAIFLVIFGAIAFIGDAVVSQYPLAQAFCIAMLAIAFIYFILLYIDIRVHVWKAKRALKEREKRQERYEEHLAKLNMNALENNGGPMELGNTAINLQHQPHIIFSEFDSQPQKPIPHNYCFMTGRHGEFLYLKLGAAWFAFGLLIHSALQISYQVIFLTSTDPIYALCASYITLALEIIFPLYSLFVLFFIFKYINVIINVYREVARFFFMHAIGTALAFWIYTIVRETSDAIALGDDYYDNNPVDIINENNEIKLFPYPECPAPGTLNTIHRNFSPYLYPFIIEFCILIVGIWYMIWANISHCPKKHSAPGHHGIHHGNEHDAHNTGNHKEDGLNDTSPNDNHTKSNGHIRPPSTISSDHCGNTTEHDTLIKSPSVVYADCHAANRGLFCGLLLIVLTIVVIVLLFVAVHEEEYFDIGVLVDRIFELIVLVILIIAVIAAYVQTAKLDINHHPMSMLDDVLLFIAIPAFFSETTFSMVPAIYNGSYLNVAIIMSQIVQVLIQTPFIIDGMRRCSNSPWLRKKKPGRELITFLLIANVSLWIYYTFSVKTAYHGDERYEFYGYTLWNILNHISLPLIMFYRFHASVCLVDMWRHSYEPEPPAH